ncbi:hypothetical protein ACHQM5_025668 [Ranunculus cassubicifolius]
MSISQFLHLNHLLIIHLKLIQNLDFILLCFRFHQFYHPIFPDFSRWLRVEGLLINECAGKGRRKSKELCTEIPVVCEVGKPEMKQ